MRDRSQIFVGGQNPLRPNKPSNLKDKRVKGRRINTAECPQKQPPWSQAIDSATLRVKQPVDSGQHLVHEREQLYRWEETIFGRVRCPENRFARRRVKL